MEAELHGIRCQMLADSVGADERDLPNDEDVMAAIHLVADMAVLAKFSRGQILDWVAGCYDLAETDAKEGYAESIAKLMRQGAK